MPEDFFYGYTAAATGNQIYLERPRINRLLEKAVQKRIVSIVAGAGYGKTQAVCAFVKTVNNRAVRIQFSERDNRNGFFWETLISSISSVNMNIARKLKKMDFPAAEKQFKKFLEILEKEILPSERYLVVYDDLHFITNREILNFLERCVLIPFFNIGSILISRTEPAFDITKPALKKTLTKINGDELRFSQDEMVSYFHLQRVSPTPQMVSAIYRDTEGWAFAVHLAGLSLRNDSSGAAYVPQALRSNTRKLIESEIMAPLTQKLRRFLIKLSLVETLSPDLVKEIAEDSSIVKEMEKINSFIRFDSYLDSYRFHNLFLEYLKELQHELSDAEKKTVWTKSAIWCAANNRKMDAIINYEKTGDYNGIINVLGTIQLVFSIPMASFVLELLDRAPKKIYRDFLMLIVIRARTLISLGRHEQCRAELLKILPELKSLPESGEKHRILQTCNMNLGFIGFIMATYTKRYNFIHFFKTAAAESKKSCYVPKSPLNGISIGSHICRIIDSSPKEMEKFIAMVGEMVPYSAEAMGGCQYGMYELVQGEYAFYKSDLVQAEKFLWEAYKMGGEKQQYEIENRALFYLLRIYVSRGNIKGTENILRLLETGLENPMFLYRHFHFDIITGWYYLQTGKKEMIAPWLKSDYTESELNAKSHGMEKLIKAKYYLAEKRYPAALASLEYQENIDIFIMGRVEIKALESICRFRLQDKKGAFKNLKEARAIARPAGLFMPFAELGKDMRSLAEAAIKEKVPGLPPAWLDKIQRNAAAYAKNLYRRAWRSKTGAEKGNGPSLSHREMNVLIGLSQGLTREEIAGAASISPNTVKSATRSIYNKLGALNHADAVRIAAGKGLLR